MDNAVLSLHNYYERKWPDRRSFEVSFNRNGKTCVNTEQTPATK